MSDNRHLNGLIRLQSFAWRAFLVIFSTASVFYFWGLPEAEIIAYWGVVLLLLVSISRLVLISEQLRHMQLRSSRFLSYLLILLLVAVIFIKFYLSA